ncbi:MAG TPA: hypothetical protein VFC39_16145 [Acidobacteriaceae bacterium]|nr:hypothetical protein [Acidobacteriaceae bacterium]
MAYPTVAEFAGLMRKQSLEKLVNSHLLTGLPFAFASAPGRYPVMRKVLAEQLGITVDDITVVGSGRLGFSLAPDKFGRPFTEQGSDIDTVVVSTRLFDQAWLELTRKGRSLYGLDQARREAFVEHRSNNIFFGFMYPDRLAGIISISGQWFAAFEGLGQERHLVGLDFEGRLYRSWQHVAVHQLYSLTQIMQTESFRKKYEI